MPVQAVAIVVYEGVQALDVAGPMDVFSEVNAVLGSAEAQAYLGGKYEAGDSVPQELDRARRYFRQCASSGHPICQFRLAKLMFEAPDRKEWEYLQALTWFQLAADRGVADARKVVEEETPKLTAEQLTKAEDDLCAA